MDTTITLDESHYKKVAERARALGQTPEQFVQALIDAYSRTFDEILAPARKGFESASGEELDALCDRALAAAREKK